MRDKIFKISVYSKVLCLLLAIIVSSTAVIGTITYGISSRALKASVSRHLDSISSEIANTIDSMNEKEFALIEGLARLDVFVMKMFHLKKRVEFLQPLEKD